MDELSKEEQDLLKQTFRILDKENEGAITSKELGVVIRALGRQPNESEVQSMINEVDSDGNGSISAEEFYGVILRKMRDTSKEDELRDSFRVFDKENNGYISTTELRAVFMALGEKLGEDELEEMIREYDIDQDNHINFEEFVNMMTLR
ncbi:calmodulin-1 [Drosophila takahashii]|uniref:calmodulin-1 n=1 Tax=Drosophila takahashii TaxID=29030 RepID=UPI001CF8ACBC|nr:neo-calmodulin [Drosophila takahashii]